MDDGDRTHDNRSHNPVLYQLSYAHHYMLLDHTALPNGTPGRTRTCDHPLRRRMLYPALAGGVSDHLVTCNRCCLVAFQTGIAVFVKRGE